MIFMASDNNIFEILQKVAENNSSSKKLTDILTENGYKGTLEDAGREIQKAEQVILENLTSDDLKNIAGGKILMNEKVKKAFATSTAALLAASAVPSQAATEANSNKHIKKNAVLDTIKSHPYHSATTASLGISTVGLLAVSLIINSKLQAAKSKTSETEGDTINLAKAKELLEKMPNGNILLNYLLQLIHHDKGKAMLKLTATQGTTPADTIVKVDDGDDVGNLCAQDGILEHSKGQNVKLENLAVYLVYCSGTPKETGGQNLLLTGGASVNKPDADKALGSYELGVLTPDGQFLAKLTANVIMRTLDKAPVTDVEDEERQSEEDDENNNNVNNENLEEAKAELLKEILKLDFTNDESTNVLNIKLYSDNNYADPADKSAQLDATYIQFLKGNKEELGVNGKQLLEKIFKWKGKTPQVIMHLFAYLKGKAALKADSAKEGFPEIHDETKIDGYKIDLFDEDTQNAINELQEKISTAHKTGKFEQSKENKQD